MITAIFRKHGLSIGSQGHENEFGYQTHENLKIRRAVNRICHVSDMPPVKKFKSGHGPGHIRGIFSAHMPSSWVYKVGPQDHDVLKAAFPDAKFVLVQRNMDSMTRSQVDKRGGQLAARQNTNEVLTDYMLSLGDYPVVDSDEVIAGDYSSLKAAFDYCGLEFHSELADECVDRTKWHF